MMKNGTHPITTAKAINTYTEVQQMTETELKPCPFCGMQLNIKDEDTSYPTRAEGVWNLGCAGVYGGCDTYVLGDDEADCIKKWNKRHGESK